MTPGKKFTVDQIVVKLREAETLQAHGLTIPQTCKRLGVSDQTFYRWRTKYGALKEDEAQRLKALEQENARLKRIVAEQALDISMLKDLSPARRRDAVAYLCRRHKVSERRACRTLGASFDAALRRGGGRLRAAPGEVDERVGRSVAALWLSEDPRAARVRRLGSEPQTRRTLVAPRRPPRPARQGQEQRPKTEAQAEIHVELATKLEAVVEATIEIELDA